MTNSRDKGARYEREIVGILKQEYGFSDVFRPAQYRGNTGAASDVEGLPGIHIECKHQEQLRPGAWMGQAVRDAEIGGGIPCVFFRKNNSENLVMMRLIDFSDFAGSAFGRPGECYDAKINCVHAYIANGEQFRIYDFIADSARAAPPGEIPVVYYRRPTWGCAVAVMRLDDFIEIYRESALIAE